ncbi:MAG: orotidine-5'-phosphate decarboxylase [Candidatus Aenigmarchaeota archaeon]|nr:orotidine-5'-phosphate decarboxylase [Candidatus Aenigmarchaeota archaeon]
MPRNFADRLLAEIDATQNPSCVGLDPRISRIPRAIRERAVESRLAGFSGDRREALLEATADAIVAFNKAVIDATADVVPAYKPNVAFYECYGPAGLRAYRETIAHIRQKGRIAIADVKREDIGDTSKSYADGFLGSVELADGSSTSVFDADAVTVSPYVGSDNTLQFVTVCAQQGRGAFILVKTSNPSSGELQDLRFDPQHGSRTLYEQMALLVDQWGTKCRGDRGYSSIGAVVGATFPEQAARIREMMENAIILVPAYGAQGGAAKDVMPNLNNDGYGAIINNSRNLIFAYTREPYSSKFGEAKFAEAAREDALAMREDLVSTMRASGRIPVGWAA